MINSIKVTGNIMDIKHEFTTKKGTKIYKATIICPRLSGFSDNLPCYLNEKMLEGIKENDVVEIVGEVRTKISERHETYIFAKSVNAYTGDFNIVEIAGNVCRPPKFRITPFGRKVTDLCIAVNSESGKSYYIWSLAWSRNALFAKYLSVGDKVKIKGRLQSREYVKHYNDGSSEKVTVYEVSASDISEMWNEL